MSYCACGKIDPYDLSILSGGCWKSVCYDCWGNRPFFFRSPSFFFPRLFGQRWGRLSQYLDPNVSYCDKCKTTWQYVDSHLVWIKDGFGSFCLCKECWKESTLEEKLTVHRKHWEKWGKDRFSWFDVSLAVHFEHDKLRMVETILG